MKLKEIKTNGYKQLLESFLFYLKEMNYQPQTLVNYRRTLSGIDLYMQENQIAAYNVSVGLSYYDDYTQKHILKKDRKNAIKTAITRLNSFVMGKEFKIQNSYNPECTLPDTYEQILDEYAIFCNELTNKDITVNAKLKAARRFLNNCISMGAESINKLNAEIVCRACLLVTNKDNWYVIREFLMFVCKIGVAEKDFSVLVPRYNRDVPLPTTYSPEEISKTEAVIDRNTKTGKRDYAIILLASRLGIRSGDIVTLTFDNIDFETNKIKFIQQKTGKYIELPLLTEIQNALDDYINNARPCSDEKKIFLRVNAPYTPITTSVLRFTLKQYFQIANIDISQKRHGFHTLRSSLANSMINYGNSYETVRTVLGHYDPNAIKHYAKLDIENLRKCAIPVLPPMENFKKFLNGGF